MLHFQSDSEIVQLQMEVVEHRTWDTKSSSSREEFSHMIDARFLLGDQNPSSKVAIAINHVSEVFGISVT